MGEVVEGPFTRAQILELRARGACDASTLVHRSGWSEWRSLESIAALLGSDQARPPTPVRGGQLPSAQRVLERVRFELTATRDAFRIAISRTWRALRSQWTELASRAPAGLTARAGVQRLSMAIERGGEQLRARAESLHPEVLLGFAVLGFMTVIGNVIGLILLAVSAPLAVQAQAALPESAVHAAATVAQVAAPSAGLVLGPRGLPALPSRDAVLDALTDPRAAIAMCTGRGTARVSINVLGNTGRVSAVAVQGVAPSSRACVQRALRTAVFPKFQQANLRVRVPFKLGQQ